MPNVSANVQQGQRDAPEQRQDPGEEPHPVLRGAGVTQLAVDAVVSNFLTGEGHERPQRYVTQRRSPRLIRRSGLSFLNLILRFPNLTPQQVGVATERQGAPNSMLHKDIER